MYFILCPLSPEVQFALRISLCMSFKKIVQNDIIVNFVMLLAHHFRNLVYLFVIYEFSDCPKKHIDIHKKHQLHLWLRAKPVFLIVVGTYR